MYLKKIICQKKQTEFSKTLGLLLSFQNYPRVRTLLFGQKSTSLITPNKAIQEQDEKVPTPAKYTESINPPKKLRSLSIDENAEVDDEEKHNPKPKVKEYVSYV